MIQIPYFAIVMMSVCAIFFYRAGEMEGHTRSGIFWAALSVLVWLITPGGYLMKLLGQVGLFIGIAAFRVVWEEYGRSRKS